MQNEKRFIIFKKIAKQGNQAVVVIPRILEKRLRPGTITRLTIDVLEEAEELKNEIGGVK
jgi:antitoxin component of MazEF toxin-antitoxin module